MIPSTITLTDSFTTVTLINDPTSLFWGPDVWVGCYMLPVTLGIPDVQFQLGLRRDSPARPGEYADPLHGPIRRAGRLRVPDLYYPGLERAARQNIEFGKPEL